MRTRKRTATIVLAIAVVAGSALVIRAALHRRVDADPADGPIRAYHERVSGSLGHPEWTYGRSGDTLTIVTSGSGAAGMDACNAVRPEFSAGARLAPPAGVHVDCRDEQQALHWRITDASAQ